MKVQTRKGDSGLDSLLGRGQTHKISRLDPHTILQTANAV